MLTQTQIDARAGKLTASRVACLMTADSAAILRLYHEMIDDPFFVPEDLSDVWAVQLGAATEALNLRWFAREYGPLSRVGEVVIGPEPWSAATLDAWSDDYLCPVEAKHCSGRENLATIIERYQPQMHWQMLVTRARQCALSVIMGATEPVVEFIEYDKEYGKELWARACAFMLCVQTKTPPVTMPTMAVPVRREKTYDLTESNSWAESAFLWLQNRAAKQIAVDAEKTLKSLVPEDAIRCHGHGVEVRRDRNNRLSLRVAK